MKVVMIRHGKVDMPWKAKYTSKEYDEAWANYDDRDILPIESHLEIDPGVKVYVSPYKRTQETARQFLGVRDFEVLEDLLNEVPLRSYKDTKRRHRRHYMNVRGRIQWYLPSKRQDELRKGTFRRAYRLIDFLEKKDGSYVLVMHGFYMRTLAAAFKRRGYRLKNRRIFGVPNLCVTEAEKEMTPG